MPATVAVTTLVLVVTTVLTGHRVLTVGLRRIWYRFCLLYAVGTGLGYGARGAVGCCHSFLGDPGSMAPLSICKATLKKIMLYRASNSYKDNMGYLFFKRVLGSSKSGKCWTPLVYEHALWSSRKGVGSAGFPALFWGEMRVVESIIFPTGHLVGCQCSLETCLRNAHTVHFLGLPNVDS